MRLIWNECFKESEWRGEQNKNDYVSVTHEKIAPYAIRGNNLGPQAVSSDVIQSSAIQPEKIANSAVTTEKLAPGAVTVDKIAHGAILPKITWTQGPWISIPPGETKLVTADCPPREPIVTGGGFRALGGDYHIIASSPGESIDDWYIIAENTDVSSLTMAAIAACILPSP